jgi:DNA-binding protein H-NS
MAKSYEQIQHQIAALQAEAEKIRRKELDDVIGRIREAIKFYGITATDLGLERKAAPKTATRRRQAAGKASAKAAPVVAFQDGQGGTWGGRGKRPQWLRDALAAGRSLDEFRVKPD